MTIGQPAASTRSASRWSWPVTPSVASISSSAMSASSMARRARTERVVLGRVVDPRPPPHAGGVDEHDRPVLGLDERVDGVAGRAGQVVDDRPILAHQAVEERALADVRPADDGHPRRAWLVGRPRRVVLQCGRRVVGRSVGHVGGRRRRSSTTTSSRSPARRPCSALIGYGSPRPSARNSQRSSSRRSLSALLATTSTGARSAPQPVGDGLVLVGHADRRVDDEQHDVGVQ